MRRLQAPPFPCLSNPKALEAVNRLLAIHSSLALSQVTSVTQCPSTQAMGILLYLEGKGVIESRLLVFHVLDDADPPVPIMGRSLRSGPPTLPFACEQCDRTIDDLSEIRYEYEFRVLDLIELTGL